MVGCLQVWLKVLQDLPENDAHRAEYITIYQAMAKSLAAAQQEEGTGPVVCWTGAGSGT